MDRLNWQGTKVLNLVAHKKLKAANHHLNEYGSRSTSVKLLDDCGTNLEYLEVF
jgi:hypothetical protein